MEPRPTPTESQLMWDNIRTCALQRSNLYLENNDIDRYERENTTVEMATKKRNEDWRYLDV